MLYTNKKRSKWSQAEDYAFNTTQILAMTKFKSGLSDNCDNPYVLSIDFIAKGGSLSWYFADIEDRDAAFNELLEIHNNKSLQL